MSPDDPPGLRANAIGTAHIVFFVVAAAAPLTAVVGVSTAAFGFGNGAGTPAVFILVGLFYLLFSAGFTAMSRYVSSSSGFYAYVAQGLGRPAGVATAALALTSYQAIAVAVYALFGYFAHKIAIQLLHVALPWWAWAIGLIAIVHLCGRRSIALSGALLAVCMSAEVAILLALSAAILMTDGIGTAPAAPLAALFTPGLGVSLVFVVASFIGFEATVIFGEEARDPARSIPRATIVAVSLIALFYALCTWTITIHYGPDRIAAIARSAPDEVYLGPIASLLGPGARTVTDLLLLTSMFAAALSFHSTIARYLAAMSREGLCHSALALIHPRHRSPHVAGSVQSTVSLGCVLAATGLGLDPYGTVFAWAGAASSLGILAVQLLTSLAVIGFFSAASHGTGVFRRLIAPALSAVGLAAALYLSVANLPLLTGSDSSFILLIPAALLGIAASGAIMARRLRRRNPAIYHRLGHAANGPVS
jgi:amino acid transporter